MGRAGHNPTINELKLRKLVDQLQSNVLQVSAVKKALEKEASQVLEEIYNKVLELDQRMTALERRQNPHESFEGTTETSPGDGAENLFGADAGTERRSDTESDSGKQGQAPGPGGPGADNPKTDS